MECSRCGKCCFEPFYKHVGAEDLEDWKARDRHDLVEAFEKELRSKDRTNPEMARRGLAFHTCRFLKPESEGRFFCSIYEFRPVVCREFEVGCSRLCPNYQGKKKPRGA